MRASRCSRVSSLFAALVSLVLPVTAQHSIPAPSAALAQRSQAGTVWIVDASGAGQFTQIQPAVDAASAGDIVLVRTGTYSAVEMGGKGLSLVEDSDAVVALSGRIWIHDVPSGEIAAVIGFAIQSPPVSTLNAIRVTDCAGAVRIESCSLRGADNASGGDGGDALFVSNAQDVSASDCQMTGGKGANTTVGGNGGRGGFALDSQVALYGCINQGGNGGIGYGGYCSHPGGAGFEQVNGGLFAANCNVFGGNGGPNDDCFFGCGGNGGSGLVLRTFPVVQPPPVIAHLMQNTFAGGAGGAHNCGYPGSPGAGMGGGTGGAQILSESARFMFAPTPVRDHGSASFFFQGQPNDSVFLLLSKTAAHQWNPVFNGVQLAGQPFHLVLELGVLPAEGWMNVEVLIPDGWVPTGQGIDFCAQGVFQSATNSVVLSNPSNVIVLDHAH